MTNDRNYLRMMHDSELTRYAQDNVRTELEFVLLERLERLTEVEDQLEAVTQERDEIDARCDRWQAQALEALDQLEAALGVK